MRIKFLLKNEIPAIGHFWHYRWSEFTHSNECKTALMRKWLKCLPKLDQHHDMNLSSCRNRCTRIFIPACQLFSPTSRPEYKKPERKVSLWSLVASHHGIQINLKKNLKISGRKIKSFPMLRFKHLDQQNSEASKYLCSIGWMHTKPSPKLHFSLSQDNRVFETSLLALNQVTKEYTTVQMTVAEEFLFRNKWTQCTSEPREN